jgi:hypothetical protein
MFLHIRRLVAPPPPPTEHKPAYIFHVPGNFEWTWQSMMRRVEAYIESHGGHFDHLLQMYSFSYNSQTNVFRHMLIRTFFLVLVCGICAQSLSASFSYIPSISRVTMRVTGSVTQVLISTKIFWTWHLQNVSISYVRMRKKILDDSKSSWKQIISHRNELHIAQFTS